MMYPFCWPMLTSPAALLSQKKHCHLVLSQQPVRKFLAVLRRVTLDTTFVEKFWTFSHLVDFDDTLNFVVINWTSSVKSGINRSYSFFLAMRVSLARVLGHFDNTDRSTPLLPGYKVARRSPRNPSITRKPRSQNSGWLMSMPSFASATSGR